MNSNHTLALTLGTWMKTLSASPCPHQIKEMRVSTAIISRLEHGYPLLTIMIGEKSEIQTAKQQNMSKYNYKFDTYFIWQDTGEEQNIEKFICDTVDYIEKKIKNAPTEFLNPAYGLEDVYNMHINSIGAVTRFFDKLKGRDYIYRQMSISLFGR